MTRRESQRVKCAREDVYLGNVRRGEKAGNAECPWRSWIVAVVVVVIVRL